MPKNRLNPFDDKDIQFVKELVKEYLFPYYGITNDRQVLYMLNENEQFCYVFVRSENENIKPFDMCYACKLLLNKMRDDPTIQEELSRSNKLGQFIKIANQALYEYNEVEKIESDIRTSFRLSSRIPTQQTHSENLDRDSEEWWSKAVTKIYTGNSAKDEPDYTTNPQSHSVTYAYQQPTYNLVQYSRTHSVPTTQPPRYHTTYSYQQYPWYNTSQQYVTNSASTQRINYASTSYPTTYYSY